MTPGSRPNGDRPILGTVNGHLVSIVGAGLRNECGEDHWSEVLDRADVSGGYSSGSDQWEVELPDVELLDSLRAHAEVSGQDVDAVLHAIGRSSAGALLTACGIDPRLHRDTRDVLLTITGAAQGELGEFHPTGPSDGHEPVVMVYRSPRRFCALVEGLVEGVSQLYDERVTVDRLTCLKRHDATCRANLFIEQPVYARR